MAARDRFTLDLACKHCGTSGMARVSEDDHPYMRSPDFRVDSIPTDFVVTKEAERMMETEIACAHCKGQVHP